LFVVSAILEGAITLAVIEALEKIQPGFVRQPRAVRAWTLCAVGLTAVLLATVGALFAATTPDGIQKLGLQTGIASRAAFLQAGSPAQAGAGLAGLGLIYVACALMVRGRRQ